MPSPEAEVRTASERFYAALNRMANGDDSLIAATWSQSPSATAMHPVGGRNNGWNQVRESFHQFALAASAAQIRLDDQLILVSGDLAYELGVERGSLNLGGQPVAIDGRVTNIYRREPGGWKLIHHHADPSQAMQEAVNLLQARGAVAH